MTPRIALFMWFLAALGAGLSRAFYRVSPIGVAITVWGLVLGLLLLEWRWLAWRDAVQRTSTRALVLLHASRFVGFGFLALAANGRMPREFALPAGLGDIAAAAGAIVLAMSCVPLHTRVRRLALAVWNLFGLLDIVLVVAMALRSGLADATAMGALRAFPLSMLPAFLAPLIIVSHIQIFVRLRRPPKCVFMKARPRAERDCFRRAA